MAVVVKKVVECDVSKCHTTKNLKDWTTINPEGKRRKMVLCATHRRPLENLQKSLEPGPQRGRRKHVPVDLSEVPKV